MTEICYRSFCCAPLYDNNVGIACSSCPKGFSHVRMYMYVCMYVSLCLSAFLSIYLIACPSVCLSVCLSVRLFLCLSVCLSVCLSLCLSVCLSFFLSVFPAVCQYVYLPYSYLDLSVSLLTVRRDTNTMPYKIRTNVSVITTTEDTRGDLNGILLSCVLRPSYTFLPPCSTFDIFTFTRDLLVRYVPVTRRWYFVH